MRFDTARISELPVINSRDVFSLALSAPGVNQLSSGQGGFAAGVDFAVNGQRVRSNNMMVDGQDNNDPSVTGVTQPINNTDIVQEARLITNQFAAEYGRAAGSVMNVITKSGTNRFRGSAFMFHQNNELNARTNLDKAVRAGTRRRSSSKPSTAARWAGRSCATRHSSSADFSDGRSGSPGPDSPCSGAPTEAGTAGARIRGRKPAADPGAAQTPSCRTVTDRHVRVLHAQRPDIHRASRFVDRVVRRVSEQQPADRPRRHRRFSPNHTLTARYLNNLQDSIATAQQATPPGQTLLNDQNQHGTNVWLSSVLSTRMTNEIRVAHQHLGNISNPVDDLAMEIPSIEISDLGLTGSTLRRAGRRSASP